MSADSKQFLLAVFVRVSMLGKIFSPSEIWKEFCIPLEKKCINSKTFHSPLYEYSAVDCNCKQFTMLSDPCECIYMCYP